LSSKSVSVALTDAEHTAWKRSAAALEVSVSDLIRQSVNYYLKARTEALGSRQEPSRRAARPSAPEAVNPRALDAAAPPLKDNHLTTVRWRFK
jgi:hypothetical protein